MARRIHPRRDLSRVASGLPDPSLDDLVRPLPRISFMPVVRSPLVAVEDHRVWHPDRIASLRTPRLWRHRLVTPKAVRRGLTPLGVRPRSFLASAIQFKAPKFLVLCVRRRRRREVIHARGIAGSRVRRGRRNQWSTIRC